jgi:hypothetical protein
MIASRRRSTYRSRLWYDSYDVPSSSASFARRFFETAAAFTAPVAVAVVVDRSPCRPLALVPLFLRLSSSSCVSSRRRDRPNAALNAIFLNR